MTARTIRAVGRLLGGSTRGNQAEPSRDGPDESKLTVVTSSIQKGQGDGLELAQAKDRLRYLASLLELLELADFRLRGELLEAEERRVL
jgi:hypothetical protein